MARREVIMEGGPAWMSLFSALMILLLAFFIIINVFSNQQTSGMKEGIGNVKDAFGLGGGFGMHQFQFFKAGKSDVPIPEKYQDPEGLKGFSLEMLEGEGGVGSTDQDTEALKRQVYLRIRLPFKFNKGEYSLTGELKDYLEKTGLFFSLYDYKFAIRSCSREFKKMSKDFVLASQRAFAIKKFMHKANVPIDNVDAVGYATFDYFDLETEQKASLEQDTFFYIFVDKAVK